MSTNRIYQLWRDLCQGHQYESPLCHAWMWNRQVIMCHAEIIKKDDVYVNQSWTVTERWLPSMLAFNFFCKLQQFWRRKGGLARTNDIIELWLVEITNGPCLVYGRDRRDLYCVAQMLYCCC